MTARTVTISREAALLISRMLPQASTMSIAAMQASAEFLTAILETDDELEIHEAPESFDDEDDGLGDRTGR